MRKDFDIAMSFCSEQSWLANDLFKLLTRDGLFVYNFNYHPNFIKERFREELKEIYSKSKVNIIIYSSDYLSKSKDNMTPIYYEFNSLWNRHIINESHEDLFLIVYDKKEINQKLLNADIRFYNLKDEGMLNIHSYFRENLYNLWSKNEENFIKYYKHPLGLEIKRKAISFCTFRINADFENDEKGRHEKYGDIEVTLLSGKVVQRNHKVYLMASCNAPFYLSHPIVLESDEEPYKKIRQKINIDFYNHYKDKEINGGLFFIETGPAAYPLPNVYSLIYDQFLIDNVEKYEMKYTQSR